MYNKVRNNRRYTYMLAYPGICSVDRVQIEWDKPGRPGCTCGTLLMMNDFFWGHREFIMWGSDTDRMVTLDDEDVKEVDKLFAEHVGVPGATTAETREKIKKATLWILDNSGPTRLYVYWNLALPDAMKIFKFNKAEFDIAYHLRNLSEWEFTGEASFRFRRRLY